MGSPKPSRGGGKATEFERDSAEDLRRSGSYGPSRLKRFGDRSLGDLDRLFGS